MAPLGSLKPVQAAGAGLGRTVHTRAPLCPRVVPAVRGGGGMLVASAVSSSSVEASAAAEAAGMYIVRAVVTGKLSTEDAARRIGAMATPDVDGAAGAPPSLASALASASGPRVVRGAGASVYHVVEEIAALLPYQHTVLCTRVEPDVAAAVAVHWPDAEYSYRSRVLRVRSGVCDTKAQRLPGTVAIISGSNADAGVAEECKLVAEHVGCYAFQVRDLGVASMDRILANLESVRAADVVIAVAGIDGALPAVLAGLVDAPVIAVPTSAGGGGATMHGVGPMLSALGSVTPVAVVNIDDGFGAAIVASRVLRQAAKLFDQRSAAAVAAAAAPSPSHALEAAAAEHARAAATAAAAADAADAGLSNFAMFATASSPSHQSDDQDGHANGQGTSGAGALAGGANGHGAGDAAEAVVMMGPRCPWPNPKHTPSRVMAMAETARPAGGGVVSASFLNAKPAVGGIGVEPRRGGVLRVLFTVASDAVADTVVRSRRNLRDVDPSAAVFDVLSDREEAQHRALWPAFLAAKAAGKRAQFHRARLVVDGERVPAPAC
ncbi:hypothetical protein FOA52_003352 [Chlamydomonas sp. UWO 241]|nr:hypothetical protein FOA52_003352 [Chlamydomonas sp. UWO 241]